VITRRGGAPLEFDVVGRMTGLPLEDIFRIAWPELSPDDALACRDEYRLIYDQTVIPATRLFDGARETVRAIHAAGLLQATVTGKRAADCERILRGLDIEDDIELYLGGDSVQLGPQLRSVRQILCERRLGADGLPLALSLHRALVDAARHLLQKHAAGSEQPLRIGDAPACEIADRLYTRQL